MITLLRPRYWPGHIAMVVAVALATGLGVWQFDAWQTRRADAARDISDEKPVALDKIMKGDDPFPGRDLGRPVQFVGTWVGDNVYVADRTLHGKRGYWVVNAVKVFETESAMPVVLGWSPTTDVAPPKPGLFGPVVGWLQATEGSGPLDEDPTDNVIPSMRIASLVEKYPVDLYSGYVVAKEYTTVDPTDQNAVLHPRPEPVTPDAVPSVSGFTALRNFLYALEWWIFAAFALFVWVRWCRDELNPVPVEPEDEE